MFSSKGCVRPSLISLFARNLVLSGSEGRVALIVTSFASLVLTARCASVKRHRSGIQTGFVQRWGLVKYVRVICHVLCLLNVFHPRNAA